MIDIVPNAGVIALGKQGENQAVRVTLPNIRAGAGSILLLHQRSDDQKPYPVPVVEADGGIIWTVSSTDTAFPGRGQAELQWLGENGAVAKSVTYQTNTTRSMAEPGAVPDEPLKPYTQAVAKDAQAAKNAAASATEAARSAEASAGQAELSATTAVEAARNVEAIVGQAGQSAQSAQTAALAAAQNAAAAETAEAGAKQAQTGAEAAKTEAQTAKTAAEKAAQEAKTAQTGAVEAKAGAETAQAKAEEAAQEAQKAAETAVLYTEQHLTNSQQEQARSNINAADKARQNVLVGTETGNPIAVDDAFAAPLCGLTVYGKSTQDGVPTPDSPVPIVSAGDGGSVAVKVTTANVLEGTKPGNPNTYAGVTYTADKNGVSAVGKSVAGSNFRLHDDIKIKLTPGVYYLTATGLTTSVYVNFYYIGNITNNAQNLKITLLPGKEYSVLLTIAKGTTVNTTVQVSLTKNKITHYSPYREQLLTLQTPNGLPGIPVASGGNYTDSTGQQWICDEVDLERAVKMQRIDKPAFDSTKTLAEQNAILATPIETPLTPAEIAAYKTLVAYAPDTVVQASDGAGVKLDYQRDVNIAVKKLEDAIASMTAT